MSFHDWLKNMTPEKAASLDRIARDAELQRERDEDAAWDDHCEKEEMK